MKNIFIVSFVVLFFSACSKDQQAIKNLNGQWEMTVLEVDGVDKIATESGNVYHFNHCKIKDGPCDGIVTNESYENKTFTILIEEEATLYTKITNVPAYVYVNPFDTSKVDTLSAAFTHTESGSILEISKTTFKTTYENTLKETVTKTYSKK